MHINELDSKAQNRAYEQVYNMMRETKNRKSSYLLDELETFIEENEIKFKENGQLIK